MRRRHHRVTLIAALVLLAQGAPAPSPTPANAGSICDPGFHCGRINLVGAGLGAGTVVGHGITCTIDTGTENGDCQQIYQFEADYLLVDLTITAAIGSTYVTATGGTALEGQPVVESVYIPGDGGEGVKDIRFNLGWQKIQLVLAGTGSGVVHHSEVGVVCEPDCTVSYPYGEKGILIFAVPDAGSTFQSWDGPCAGQTAGCKFDMPKSTTMTATFTLKPAATTRPPTPKPTVTPTVAASHSASAPPTTEPTAALETAQPTASIASPSAAATLGSSVPPIATLASSDPTATGPETAPTGEAGSSGIDPLILLLLIGGMVLAFGGGLFVARSRRGGTA